MIKVAPNFDIYALNLNSSHRNFVQVQLLILSESSSEPSKEKDCVWPLPSPVMGSCAGFPPLVASELWDRTGVTVGPR